MANDHLQPDSDALSSDDLVAESDLFSLADGVEVGAG
jgi:hypothetical protein